MIKLDSKYKIEPLGDKWKLSREYYTGMVTKLKSWTCLTLKGCLDTYIKETGDPKKIARKLKKQIEK